MPWRLVRCGLRRRLLSRAAAVHAFTKMHLDWLEDVVREGVERGQFSIGEQRPRDVAVQIFASVQGTLLTGRLISDPHVIDQVAAELRSYLGYASRPRWRWRHVGALRRHFRPTRLASGFSLLLGRETMTQTKPRLITFGISHFCEKARWALDWHGIPYSEIGWPPGLHIVLAKRCGAKGTTLPILLDGEIVIQGSGAIIDWAESKAQDCSKPHSKS